MTDHSEAVAGPGHNMPPEVTLADRLQEAHAAVIANLDTLAELANGAPKDIADDRQAADVADLAARAGDLRKKLDAIRKKEKDPFLTAEREVDGFFRDPIARADRIDKALMQRVTAYTRAKAEKERFEREETARKAREAEEAARRQAEEAMSAGRTEDAMADIEDAQDAARQAAEVAAAPVSASEATRIHTDGGMTVTPKTEWAFEIVDPAKVDLEALRPFIKPDAIEAAVRAFVRINKGTRQIAGVRIFEDMKATRRR